MKQAKVIQHTLIPIALIAGNIGLAHLIYLLANGMFSLQLPALAITLVLLGMGILKADRLLLLIGTGAYILILLFTLLS